MKYNTLRDYHDFLFGARAFSRSTAKTYCDAVDLLLADQFLLDSRQLNIEQVMKKLKHIKHKQQYSKYKNAFLYFCEYLDLELDDKIIYEIETMNKDKTKKHRKMKSKKFSDIQKQILSTKDQKLKLSYEVLLATGLRVSELTQLKKENCKVSDDIFIFSFVGKGQRAETVTFTKSENETLFSCLSELIKETPDNKKVFYSTKYLQTKAQEKGFACHDLRRAFAKSEYQKTKDVNKVMEVMRHHDQKTTKIYLDSKIEL